MLSIGINPETIDEILSILRLTCKGGNSGLPIGGNSFRIIAEAVLNGFDQVLIENNLDFMRFVDDFVLSITNNNDQGLLLHSIYHYVAVPEKADKPLIASSIIFVMGKWDQHDWLMDRLKVFGRMNSWERRSLIMAIGGRYDYSGVWLTGAERLLVG